MNGITLHAELPSSFYMDETEVRNLDYQEYLYWLERVFVPADLKVVWDNAQPDQNVWRDQLKYAETQVEYYFKHPSFREYPVVGVNWLQATNYAAWRTDRVNEMILAEQGFINWNPEPTPEGYFNTEAYLTYESYEAEEGAEDCNILQPANTEMYAWKTEFYYLITDCLPKPNGSSLLTA